MRHFIVVAHAYMAKGMVSSLELILGKQSNVSYYCAYTEPNIVYKEKLLKEINNYATNDEIIIMTDLFGGSVNNELLELIFQRRNIHLISGINLILLIGMVISNEDEDISSVIHRNIEESKNGIIYCNDLNMSNNAVLDDF